MLMLSKDIILWLNSKKNIQHDCIKLKYYKILP